MSFPEINKLRKTGQLPEAYHLAAEELRVAIDKEEDQNTLWAKRGLYWILFDYLKINIDRENVDNICKILEQIKALEIPDTEAMFFDQIAWQYGKALFLFDKIKQKYKKNTDDASLKKLSAASELLISTIFTSSFTKPSAHYSYILNGLNKLLKDVKNKSYYGEIIEKWNLENLRKDDFKKIVLSNGKSIPSLAEQVFNAYCKACLDKLKNVWGVGEKEHSVDVQIINGLEEVFGNADFKYKKLYYSKIHAEAGNKKRALEVFIPFAKQNVDLFWVWEALGDYKEDNSDMQLKCYAKAISLSKNEKYSLNLYEKIAKICIAKEQYNEAKSMLIKYVDIRRSNNWKVKGLAIKSQTEPWYINAEQIADINATIADFSRGAEDIVAGELPDEIIIVTAAKAKKENHFGFVRYNGSKEIGFAKCPDGLKPSPGDVLRVKIENPVKAGRPHKLYKAEKTTENPAPEICTNISGVVRSKEEQNFGFLISKDKPNTFIPPQTMEKYSLKNGDTIKGKMVASYNWKKDSWGWILVRPELVSTENA